MTDDRAEKLAQTAAALAVEVRGLRRDVAGNRRFTRWLGAGLALMVALMVGLGVVAHGAHKTDVAQKRTDQQVLCPLYKVFVDSYDIRVRDARPPEKRADYDIAHAILRQGYETLGCPPRVGVSPTPSPRSSPRSSPTPSRAR